MAGGVGSRFWPLSTPRLPKQFIDILGCGRTLIQLTVDRFLGVCPESDFWVVTNQDYVPIVRQQLPGIPQSHILAEPAARNTAPCIAWACWSIGKECPDSNIVVTPSDAVVLNPQEFRRVISASLEFTASNNRIVTIGITPNRPETGYGYVQYAAQPAQENKEILPVAQFREKPDLATAQQYLLAGNFLWNAGIFVWNAHTITDCIRQYKPAIAELMDQIVQDPSKVQALFPTAEKISIDYAVMEPAAAQGLVYTHPADFGWSDLGNWTSLHEKLQADQSRNTAVGPVTFVDCANTTVHCEDATKVILQGLDGYIVSLKNGQLLVCQRSQEQHIKEWNA